MNQEQFIKAHEQQWLIMEVLLDPLLLEELLNEATPVEEHKKNRFKEWQRKRAAKKKKIRRSNQEKFLTLNPELLSSADFPGLYREICQHLSLAQSRRYSPYLINRLSSLIDQAHQVFYKSGHTHGQSAVKSFVTFFSQTFPQTVRNESKWVWLSSAVFYLPLIIMIVLIQYWPEFVYSIMSPDTVASMEAMYDPQAEHIGRERGSDSDSKMFGFYIFNNTGIGFRTFATGLLFGIGSLLTLLFNGLYIGAVAGHLTQIGYSSTFWSFVSGHSAMELTAIALSGAAGLKLGFSLFIPGRKSRYQSVLDAAKVSVKIMAGAAIMFFIAAFIEAFWSSSQSISANIKYIIGIGMWIMVLSYFIFVGHKLDKME
ncbi:MAG: stage II sporulation protein M [Gammaproteobacteria bacterium]|nr:stage II sporulation protein M [Gammaproteobacteria bacterium]